MHHPTCTTTTMHTSPQALLLEVQSVAAVCPGAVPALLRALGSAQRAALGAALCSAAPLQGQLPLTHQQWLHQLHMMGLWDILLLLGLCSDSSNWEAEASLVLLQGLRDMPR